MARAQATRTLVEHRIDDFSGGLNNTNVATLIKDNEAQTATNVFCNLRGGVEKRYGFANYTAGLPFSSLQPVTLMVYKNNTGTSDTIIMCTPNTSKDEFQYVLAGATGSSWTSFSYTNGTATFTQNSPTVTLITGTQEWSTQLVVGDNITADAGTTWYAIQSVDSNTQVTLTSNFLQTTTTAAYRVSQRQVSGQSVRGVMYNGNLYYGPLRKSATDYCIGVSSNGTTTKRVTGTPSGYQLSRFANFKNYLFAADSTGSATKSSRLYWSALLDATTWPSTNFVDVSPNDGTYINGLLVHNDILYIFKDTSIWYLIGDVFDPSNPTYSLKKVINSNNIGTSSGDSVAVLGNRILFLGQDGVYALNGVNSIQNISENKIRTTIRSINNLGWARPVNPPYACATVYDNRYWLSIGTGSSADNRNDTTIVIEPNGSYTTHTFGSANFVLAQVVSSGATISTKSTMTGINPDTFRSIYFDGTATSDGASATNATWTSKVFNFGNLERTTHVEDVYVAYYNTTNQAASLLVYDDSGQVGSTAAWTFPGGTTQFITVQRFEVNRDTNGLYLSVTDNTSNKSFRIMGIVIRYWKDTAGSGVIVTT